ncbi:hypothetical protein L3X38_027900 [Prunus dulcis]|uniref:Uncharacterized protein n=1 Tax=Prunus dulcis TaxID=3755 RepID=A0AAD4VNX5_PRUDU|nr:hypothetical protein L3X38_027900 [Prunus dulcis]
MQPHLFNKVMHDICNYDAYFVQKCDATGVLGLLPEQKLTAVIRMLAYGTSAYQVDEIAHMGKSTTLEALVRFCQAVETLYTRDYLRRPTPRDLQLLLQKAEARGFPGMICAACIFDEEILRSIMMTCIILHNMIVEDEYDYDALEVYKPDPRNTALTRIYERPMGPSGEPFEPEPLVRDVSHPGIGFAVARYCLLWAPLSALTVLFLGGHDQLPSGSPILGLL